MLTKRLFDLEKISNALKGFQTAFPEINSRLEVRREDVTDTMISQILQSYTFLNSLLRLNMDLFTPAGLYNLLELNHIVLCGTDQQTRLDYYSHLNETRKGFIKKILPIKEWVLEKKNEKDPFKIATGYYSRALSQPQLFIEGNHRTGNIILNYLLVSAATPPYIISAQTALQYLDLSSDIKYTNKENSLQSAWMMPGHRKRFQEFLKNNVSEGFLQGVGSK